MLRPHIRHSLTFALRYAVLRSSRSRRRCVEAYSGFLTSGFLDVTHRGQLIRFVHDGVGFSKRCAFVSRGVRMTSLFNDAISTVRYGWRSLPAPAVLLLGVGAVTGVMRPTPADAQVVLPVVPFTEAPWNAQEVFEPVPFAQRWARTIGEPIAPEDMPVKTRQHPGYEPIGVRAGAWMIHPSLTVGGEYDSNVFASPNNRQGDYSVRVQPSLRAATLWERHAFSFQGDVRTTRYRANPSLDTTDASLRGRARIDLTHASAILASFRVAHLNEAVGNISSPTGAVEPTPYDLYSGDITYRHEFNRVAASVGVRFDSYDFGTTRRQDGAVINQDSRDGRIYTGHGRLDYALTPKLGLFAAAEVNRRDLRGSPGRPLDSDGYRALGGLNVEFSRLIWGEFGFGYARQSFASPAIGAIEGPSYRALLTWSPLRTVDVTLKAEQVVTQASETDASGIKADAVQLGVDYEFRRNVVLSVAGTYEKDRFFGQPRRDTVYATTAELKYLLNRIGSISLRHRYLERDSNVPQASYSKHEVGIHVTAQY
jgi:hypothetical protein